MRLRRLHVSTLVLAALNLCAVAQLAAPADAHAIPGLSLVEPESDYNTELAVTKSTVGTADDQTQGGWQVPDLAELRSRGVEIQEYDMPELRTVDGVADLGFAIMERRQPG